MESSMDDGSESFIHEPLQAPDKQIRLLRFVRAGPDDVDEIAIELSAWPDDEAPEYKAISYTWGNSSDLRSIYIDGKLSTVRNNCHYALWQTWLHWPNDYIWIDSICINQDDVGEKSVQVQKMGQIYANATAVLVCVGPHLDGSERLQVYASEIKSVEDSRSRPRGSDWALDDITYNATDWAELRGQEYVNEATAAMQAFATRSYWSRLWIVQEVILAKKKIALCGNHMLEWSSVISFVKTAHSSTYLNTLVALGSRKLSHLGGAISSCRDFHCSDVRDRMYGIIGLIDWDSLQSTPYIVDYTLTSFDLLSQVVNDLELTVDDVVNAMHMFGHTSGSSEMQELIAYARQESGLRSNEVTVRPKHALDARNILVSPNSHCQIHESPDGVLVANFCKKPEDPQFPGPPGFEKYVSLNVSDSEIPDCAKRLYSGYSLCALLCAEAKKGDLVVATSFPRDDNLLVLRPLDGESYSIVGQALSVNDFQPTIDEQFYNTKMEVKLTTLEALLLHGQDFSGFDSSGQATHDRQAQLQRLQTAVILHSEPIARATLHDRSSGTPSTRFSPDTDDYADSNVSELDSDEAGFFQRWEELTQPALFPRAEYDHYNNPVEGRRHSI